MDLEGHMWLFSSPKKMAVPIGGGFVILPGMFWQERSVPLYLIPTGAIDGVKGAIPQGEGG